MQKKSLLGLLLLLIVLIITSGVAVFAADAETGELYIHKQQAENGIVEVNMYVKNTTFAGIQTAFRYDPTVWTPIDEVGNPAVKFEDFAVQKASFLTPIGLMLNNDKGLFQYTLFVMPETKAEEITEDLLCVADEEGILLYTFRFKQIAEGNPKLEVAIIDDSLPYEPVLPDGLLCVNYDSELVMHVYIYDVEPAEEPEVYVYGTYAPPPEMTKSLRKQDVVCLLVGNSTTVTKGKKTQIDADDRNVVPYIENDRTYVPLRFISEAFGAEVIWEEGMDGCIIKKDDVTLELTFNSTAFKVNGEIVESDVPIQLKHDRTMVPVRFVTEHLGCDVYWNEKNEAVVIAPAKNPWVADRRAEIDALNEMLLTIVGIL